MELTKKFVVTLFNVGFVIVIERKVNERFYCKYQVNFTIAVHILTLIAQNKGNETKLTGDLWQVIVGLIQLLSARTLSLASSLNLISVQRKWRSHDGQGTRRLTLQRVYRAVDIGPRVAKML